MNIRIIQSAGFGDIFFCQKIGKRLIELGYTVYWPIYEPYGYVKDYIPDFHWCEPPNDNYVDLDLGQASHLMNWEDPEDMNEKVMESKYLWANKHYDIGDYSNWNDYFRFNRFHEKEEMVCEKVLKDIPEKFCLINRFFATECIYLETEIKSDLPMVEIRKLSGFSIFDWSKVIEKASEIRIPDSSFPYIVEVLNTTENLYLYNRSTEPHLRTKNIWTKNWEFVE